MSSDIYKEELLEHAQNPMNKGRLKKADSVAAIYNTLCGDYIKVYITVKKGAVNDIRFQGEGCAISQAAASMITEKVKGMKIEEVRKLRKEDVLGLLKIELSPTRLKCGLLALDAIQKALP